MSHPAPEPHDALEKIFDDAWYLPGTVRMGPGLRINRNMAVIRDGEELTIFNPVRMKSDDALNELGKVTNVVRLGCFHRMDDPYYVDTFGAKFWCLPGGDDFEGSPKADAVIEPGGASPVSDGRFIAFDNAMSPEAVFLLERNGGLLVSCDSIQHHTDFRNVSFLGRIVMRVFGFLRPMNIGPPWKKKMTPEGGSLEADFRKILEATFDKAIGAHGGLCGGDARALLEATVNDAFR